MKAIRRQLVICIACLMAGAFGLVRSAIGADTSVVRIGVLANRGLESCLTHWTPTADYLSEKIPGKRFQIVPIDFDQIHGVVQRGEVEFIFANPSFYVELEVWYRVNAIATLKNRHTSGVCTRFAGVVFSRADRSDLKTWDDLKGKRFAAVDAISLGGWHMAWRELLEKGIEPHKDFRSLEFSGTHDAVVYAVLRGQADAGTVRSDTLERMAAEGLIGLEQFRVLRSGTTDHDDIPFLHSTRAYPEWPMARVRHTDGDLAQAVAVALLQMPQDAPAALAAGCGGWGIPLNYQSVHDCLRFLKVGPYKDLGRITPLQAARAFWKWLLVGFVSLLVLGSATLIIVRLNHRLTQSNQHLRKEAEWRQQATDALAESEQFNRTIISSIGDGLVVYDSDLRYRIWNRRMEEITGLQEQQVVGQSAFDLFPHLRQQGIDLLLKRALAGERVISPDTRFSVPQTGRSGWVVGSYTPHINAAGRIIGVVGVVTDISDRKRAEEELTTYNEQFRSVMDGLDASVYVADMETHELLYMNQFSRSIWGDAVGQICWQVLQSDQKGPCPFCNNHRLLDAEGHPTGIHVWEFKNTFNRCWYQCRDQAIRWLDGRFVRLEIAMDITERKYAEEQLQHQNRFLNHVLESLTHPFMVINAEDFTVEIANAASGDLFEGYKCHQLTHHSDDPCGGQDHPCLVETIKRTGEQMMVEHVHYNRYGEPRHVEVYGYPIFDQQGQVSRIIEYSLDVSERKRAEKELYEKEEYLRTVMATIQTGVLICAQDSGTIVDVNPFATRLIGAQADAIKGSPWTAFVEEGPQRGEIAQAEKQGENAKLKTILGEAISIRLSKAQANIRGQEYTILSFLDISDLQEMLEQQVVNIELAKGLLTLVNPSFTRFDSMDDRLGLHIEATSLPSSAAGGDHFFVRHFPGNEDGMGPATYVSVKDQSGHEVNCILRSIFTDLIHNAILQESDSISFELAIQQLNDRLVRGGIFADEHFLTGMMARIDHATLTMQYTSCGHPPFLLIRDGNVLSLPQVDGPGRNLPLGTIEGIQISSEWVHLQERDRLLFYTDGLTEMPLEKRGWKISRHRLEELVAELVRGKAACHANDMMHQLLAAVADMSNHQVRYPDINTSADDVTLVVLEIEDLSDRQERILLPRDAEELNEHIRELSQTIAGQWEMAGLYNCTQRVRVVLEEAALNSWKRGHRGQLDLPITVRWREGNDFHLEVIDGGVGFDPDRVLDPTSPQNWLKMSGRGIYMIRLFADQVWWKDGGRHLVASFFRHPQHLEASRRKPYRDAIPLWQTLNR